VRCCRLKTSIFLGAYLNVTPGVASGLSYRLVGQGSAMRALLTNCRVIVSLFAAAAAMAAIADVLDAPVPLMRAMSILGAYRFWNISCVQIIGDIETMCRSGLRIEASMRNRIEREIIA
jgi:hypothetical protein